MLEDEGYQLRCLSVSVFELLVECVYCYAVFTVDPTVKPRD